MIVVLPVSVGNESCVLSKKFARSPWFAIVNKGLNRVEYVENPYCRLDTDAGPQVVEYLVDLKKADTFIAFELGYKVQLMAMERDIRIVLLADHLVRPKELTDRILAKR